jgi:lycopene beta-cyclase
MALESTVLKMRQGPSRSRADVAVLGGGPAGTALAAALADEGLAVICVSLSDPRTWRNGYGLWLDEAARTGVADCLLATWPKALVRIDEARAHSLDRGYARVDNAALAERLLARCQAGGVSFIDDAAEELTHEEGHTRVRLRSGALIDATLIVDATGQGGRFSGARPTRPAAQVAVGVLLQTASHPFPKDEVVLMDWRPARSGDGERSPSFLYALPMGEGRVFLEETSLVASPPMQPALLERRLEQRLEALGLQGRVLEKERCFIPMGEPLPDPGARVLGYGAAGGLVHPATGYMLAGALLFAPPVACAIAHALRGQARPQEVARAGAEALWPPARREARALQVFGMDVVRGLSGEGIRAFFDAFFTAAEDEWPELLRFDGQPERLATLMDRTFRRLPASLKLRASLQLSLRHPSLVPHLARALLLGASAPGAPPPAL